MAVLVFLAGAAGARLVAADLAPGRGVFRIAFGLRAIAVADQHRHQRGERHFVLAGGGVDLVRFHVRQFR